MSKVESLRPHFSPFTWAGMFRIWRKTCSDSRRLESLTTEEDLRPETKMNNSALTFLLTWFHGKISINISHRTSDTWMQLASLAILKKYFTAINERQQRFNFSLFYRSAMSFVVRSVKPVKALIFGRVDLNGHCEECQRHVRSSTGT